MKKQLLLPIMLILLSSINAQLETYQFQVMNDNNFGSFSGMTEVFANGDFDTDDAANIPIGFDFKYGGQIYNTLTISVDGAISFTTINIYGSNDLSNTTSHYSNIIAPFWDDLKLLNSDGGVVTYKTMGNAPNRVFVVEWLNIRRYGHTGTMSFRLFLKETTNYIKFQYGPSNIDFADASIGFNANDGSNASFVSVTPGSPATISTTTANNDISNSDYPAGKIYVFSPRPVNDRYDNAIQINFDNCANSIAAYNAGATPSIGNEPSCAGYVTGNTRDIWYKFTAPQRGAIKINRLSNGDWSSISYAIHHGTSMNGTIVACNFIPYANTSQEIYNLIPGDDYLIRMWDYNNDNFGYAYFCIESLDNDDGVDAFPIDVQAENSTVFDETLANNVGATDSANAAPTCANYNGGDVWFKFVAPSTGQIAVVHSDTPGDWSSLAFAIYDDHTSQSALYCDFIPVMGNSAPYHVKIVTGLNPGDTYYLRTWDYNNDDFGTTLFYLREDSTSGLEDYKNLNFTFYPNPADDILNVSAKNKIKVYTISNIAGQILKKGNPNDTQTRIHIDDLSKGIYLLNIQMGDQSTTIKFLKN
jgi:hypothetical protein